MGSNSVTDKDLWNRYKTTKDRKAKEDLILSYLPLVKYVAGRLAMTLPPHVDSADLVSYGTFGLMEAIERFSPERGVKFETFAIARIKGAILDGLRAADWVPSTVRQRVKALEKAYRETEAKLMRAATDKEVAETLGITETQMRKRLNEAQWCSMLSLDDVLGSEDVGDETVRTGISSLVDRDGLSPDVWAELSDVKRALAKAIDALPEKERLVVCLYYYEGLTVKEIGEVMGLSQSRVSQLHTRAIMRLRGRMYWYRNYGT